MAGIVRISITDVFYEDRRTRLGEIGKPIADQIYRETMKGLNIPLKENAEEIRCTKKDVMARYDWREGIDVILYCQNGSKFTLQEKFLSPNSFPKTVTIEEFKASGKQGAWFDCTAQWYFVGYYANHSYREFSDWILVDFPGLRLKKANGELLWFRQEPKDPRRGGPFLCFRFADIPDDIVVARKNGNGRS